MLLPSLQSSGKDAYLLALPGDGCHYLAVIGWRSDDSTFLTEVSVSQPNTGSCHCLPQGRWAAAPGTCHQLKQAHSGEIKGLRTLREAQTGQHQRCVVGTSMEEKGREEEAEGRSWAVLQIARCQMAALILSYRTLSVPEVTRTYV